MDVDEYMAIHTYIPFVFHMQLLQEEVNMLGLQRCNGGRNCHFNSWLKKVEVKVLTKLHAIHCHGDLKVSSSSCTYICKHINCTTALLFGLFAGATKFIHKLDGRYKKDCLKRGSSIFQAKTRTPGSPSTLPRLSGLEWTLKPAPVPLVLVVQVIHLQERLGNFISIFEIRGHQWEHKKA